MPSNIQEKMREMEIELKLKNEHTKDNDNVTSTYNDNKKDDSIGKEAKNEHVGEYSTV